LSRLASASSELRASPLGIWAALAAIYLIWGSTYLAIRLTVATLPPFLSAAARFLVSGAFLYVWRRMSGDAAPGPIEWRNAAIIGCFLLVGGNGGVVWGAQFIPSSLSALLVATVPLWMVAIDVVRPGGERPGSRAATGIAVGFAGAVLLLRSAAADPSSFNPAGAIAVLLACVSWAMGSLYGRSAALPASSLLVTGMEMLAGGSIQVLIAISLDEWNSMNLAAVSRTSALALLYLTVVGSGAFVAYAWLLRVAPTPLVATYAYVNPLVAVLLGYFFADEFVTVRTLLAAALIIGSVVLVSTAGTGKDDPAQSRSRV